MGHSTPSGRAKASTAAAREPATKVRGSAAPQPTGRVSYTQQERRAVENFLNEAPSINSERGQQIASNAFQFAGMTNERAVAVMNSLGRGEYELQSYTARRYPGPASQRNPNYVTTYIRRRRR